MFESFKQNSTKTKNAQPKDYVKIVRKEMALYETSSMKRSQHLERLFKALLTIKIHLMCEHIMYMSVP